MKTTIKQESRYESPSLSTHLITVQNCIATSIMGSTESFISFDEQTEGFINVDKGDF